LEADNIEDLFKKFEEEEKEFEFII